MPRAIAAIKAILAERHNAASSSPTPPTVQRRHGFDPNQPRLPKGDPQGGEWTRDGYNDRQILSDATPDNDWIPGAQYAGDGHHHAPQALYKELPPETRQVLSRVITGPIPLGIHQNGQFLRHQFDDLHREYNKAVEELMNRFLRDNNIRPEQMTPDHARKLLDLIASSEEPRIKFYRNLMITLRRLYRLRIGGRGNE